MNDLNKQVEELSTGHGYLVIPQLFSAEKVKQARDIIMAESAEADKVTHFQGKNSDKLSLQRRVWNLLNKGDIFVEMVQHPQVIELVGKFLGNEFCLGSIAANRILPGGPGQEPHIDYPYWDMHKRESFPNNINASFPLNCQVTIMLDEFSDESGATAILPESQNLCRYPNSEDEKMFYEKAARIKGQPGDVAVFFGMTWHCAMPNKSTHDRTGILIQYLPKFIKPMEDQKRGVRSEVIDNASPLLKQLLGFDYPYPQILEEAKGGNTEGRVV
ncbi:MAG: phytanoyl-CoA dioxygenase [Candidatus Portiera sp.]|nr:phytanoyl-CoA dioxygenase [Portiera sp.]